jgi:hypothetical protein
MKFHVAWDAMQKENIYLKVGTIALLCLSILLTAALTNVAVRDPLVIDRACFPKVAGTVAANPTDDETKAFVEEAVAARFNSDTQNPYVLSLEQQSFKHKEQAELSKQKMSQTVLVRSVELSQAGVVVQADRIISVGDIRSAFRFPLKVFVEKDVRSEVNPYGLILVKVENLESAKK